MHDVFISYSSEDIKTANAVCHKMEENGIRCWIAPRDIKPGADWASSITEAIKKSKVFVLIFSDNTNQSGQVSKELTLAVNYHLLVFPFKITPTAPTGSYEYLLSDVHWLDAIDKPMDLCIEHMKEVVSLYLSENTNDFMAKRDEEERRFTSIIRQRKKRKLIKKCSIILFGVLILALLLISLFDKLTGTPERMKGYTATLYLMRYQDVDSKCHTHQFTESALRVFRYEKDYNEQGEHYIFPCSDYIAYQDGQTVTATHFPTDTMPSFHYHWPVFQLRLNNHSKETITMSEAVLEISDLYRDDRPAFRFNLNGKGLQISNENYTNKTTAQLLYSSLIPGESFLKYKKKRDVVLASPCHLEKIDDMTDSILGELIVPDCGKYGFIYGHTIDDKIPSANNDEDSIPVYNLKNTRSQEIPLKGFNRSLIKNENDTGVYFKMSSMMNTVYKMRVRIKVNGKKEYLYSNYVRVRLVGFTNQI